MYYAYLSDMLRDRKIFSIIKYFAIKPYEQKCYTRSRRFLYFSLFRRYATDENVEISVVILREKTIIS